MSKLCEKEKLVYTLVEYIFVRHPEYTDGNLWYKNDGDIGMIRVFDSLQKCQDALKEMANIAIERYIKGYPNKYECDGYRDGDMSFELWSKEHPQDFQYTLEIFIRGIK